MAEESMLVDRLPELASEVETEFSGRVYVQTPHLNLEDGESAVSFEPVNSEAAPLVVRLWYGAYSIEYANELALDSFDHVPADEAFDWALDQVFRVARFGLVLIATRRLLGMLPDSQYLVPSHPIGSLAFEKELQRRVRPAVQRIWAPW